MFYKAYLAIPDTKRVYEFRILFLKVWNLFIRFGDRMGKILRIIYNGRKRNACNTHMPRSDTQNSYFFWDSTRI